MTIQQPTESLAYPRLIRRKGDEAEKLGNFSIDKLYSRVA